MTIDEIKTLLQERFVEDIAWDSSVWIADEPYNVIHFVALSHDNDRDKERAEG